MNDIFDIFIRRKAAKILMVLKNQGERNCSQLAKEVNCTYSHAARTLNKMKKAKLISFEKPGRTKIIKISKTGIKIAENIEKIKDLFTKLYKK